MDNKTGEKPVTIARIVCSSIKVFSNAVRHNTKGKTMKFANIGGDMPKKPPTKPTPASAKKPAKKKC